MPREVWVRNADTGTQTLADVTSSRMKYKRLDSAQKRAVELRSQGMNPEIIKEGNGYRVRLRSIKG
jgi:hypothetical protein